MRVLLACLVALAMAHRAACAGLDLSWNTCVTQSPADDLSPVCEEGGVFTLYANFQSPRAIPGFVALDAVFDLDIGDDLPPFWQLQAGGCNENGLVVQDARQESACPAASNPSLWGLGGGASDAFLGAYAPGAGGRAAFLITIARSSSSPVALQANQNYYAFHVDFFTDAVASCEGCGAPANISWRTAALYDVSSGAEPTVLGTPGQRSKMVTLNGGLSGMAAYSGLPNAAFEGTQPVLGVFGRGFDSGASLRLERQDNEGILATEVSVAGDQRSIQGTLDLAGAALGLWDLVAEQSSGLSRIVGGFEVRKGFWVADVQPDTLWADGNHPLLVIGRGIRPGATVALRAATGEMYFGPTEVSAGGDSLRTSLYWPAPPSIARFQAVVTNSDGLQAASPDSVDVVGRPTFHRIVPGFALQGLQLDVSIEGEAFHSSCVAWLERPGETVVQIGEIAVAHDGRSLSGQLDLAGSPSGSWDLVVLNPGDASVRVPEAFRVVTKPTIDSVSPSLCYAGSLIDGVVNGHDFARVPTTVRFESGGATVEVLGAVTELGTAVSFSVTMPTQGVFDVIVSNAALVSDTLGMCLTVNPSLPVPPPGIDSIVPNWIRYPGDRIFASVHGHHLSEGAIVTLVQGDSLVQLGSGIRSPDGSVIYVNKVTPSWIKPGLYDVVISDNGGFADTLAEAFMVHEGVRIDSIVPSRVSDLDDGFEGTVHGKNIQPGSKLRFFGLGLIQFIVTLSVDSPDSVAVWFNTYGRRTGAYDVQIQSPDGDRKTYQQAFAILYGPRIDSLAPRKVFANGVAHVRLFGRPFPPLSAVELRRDDEPPIVGAVASEYGRDYLDVLFDVRGRTSGQWDVVVTTNAFISDTLDGSFGTLPGEDVEDALESGIEVIEDTPTAVVMEDLVAVRRAAAVEIRVRLGNPSGEQRFSIDRSSDPVGLWATILSDRGPVPREWEFVDRSAPEEATWYRVRQQVGDGPGTVLGTVGVEGANAPMITELASIHPNPSQGPVRIRYSLARASHASLDVHDVLGRRIATLTNGQSPAGRHETSWAPPAGRLANGIYFAVLDADGKRFVRRFLLTR